MVLIIPEEDFILLLPIWFQLNDPDTDTRKKMIPREKRLKTSSDDVLTRGGGDTRDDDGDQQLDMFKVVPDVKL